MHLPNKLELRSKVLPQVFDVANETLNLYFQILQQSWPLEGWAVLQKVNDGYQPLVVSGCFKALAPSDGVQQLLYQHWDRAAQYNEYMYRALSGEELATLRSQLNDEVNAHYLFRVALHDTKGEVVGQLLGACSDLPFYRWSSLCQHITACVHSMSMMVALLDELGAAEVSMAAATDSSFYDEETGVLNRAGWIYQLNMLETLSKKEEDKHISIFVVRLAESMNDTQDMKIKDVAKLLNGLIRGKDVLGRIENHTFAIIAQHANPFIAQRLQARLTNALACKEHDVGVGAAGWLEGDTLSARLRLAQARANDQLNNNYSVSSQQVA